MATIIEYSVSIERPDDGIHFPYEIFSISFSTEEENLTPERARELIKERFDSDFYNKTNETVSDMKLDKSFTRISVHGVSLTKYVPAGFTITSEDN